MRKNEKEKTQVLIYLQKDTARKLDDLRHDLRFAYKTDMFESMAQEFIKNHTN